MSATTVDEIDEPTREGLIRLLSAITFLIFFQAFMVAWYAS